MSPINKKAEFRCVGTKKRDLLDVVVDQIAAKFKLSDEAKKALRALQPTTLGELLLGRPAAAARNAAAALSPDQSARGEAVNDNELATVARRIALEAGCSPLEALAGLVVASEGSPFGPDEYPWLLGADLDALFAFARAFVGRPLRKPARAKRTADGEWIM